MSSMSGFITYIKYVAGTNKGETEQGDLFNSPFALGNVDKNYTDEKVIEKIDSTGGLTFAWTPVVYEKPEDIRVLVDGAYVPVPENKLIKDDNGKVIGIAASYMAEGTKVAYKYDNVVIPQNDLPILNAKMESIALVAHARRIAVYYSQIAAFQA